MYLLFIICDLWLRKLLLITHHFIANHFIFRSLSFPALHNQNVHADNHQQRNDKPQKNVTNRAQITFLFLLTEFQFIQTIRQHVFIRQAVITPLIQNDTILYQVMSSIWQKGYSAPVLSRHNSICSSGEEVRA